MSAFRIGEQNCPNRQSPLCGRKWRAALRIRRDRGNGHATVEGKDVPVLLSVIIPLALADAEIRPPGFKERTQDTVPGKPNRQRSLEAWHRTAGRFRFARASIRCQMIRFRSFAKEIAVAGFRIVLQIAVAGGLVAAAWAGPLELDAPWGEHMVLQADRPAHPTGRAAPGEEVRLTFRGETVTARADTQGRWEATLSPPPAGGPEFLTVASGGETISLTDVLAGHGPMLASLKRDGNELIASFDDTAGLAVAGGRLLGFELAGPDGVWQPADARIADGTVHLSTPAISAPTRARYAWGDNPIATLRDARDLPALPFAEDTVD